MLAVVAYLRHADSKGVSSPGTLRVPGYGRVPSLCDDECGDVDDVAVMWRGDGAVILWHCCEMW